MPRPGTRPMPPKRVRGDPRKDEAPPRLDATANLPSYAQPTAASLRRILPAPPRPAALDLFQRSGPATPGPATPGPATPKRPTAPADSPQKEKRPRKRTAQNAAPDAPARKKGRFKALQNDPNAAVDFADTVFDPNDPSRIDNPFVKYLRAGLRVKPGSHYEFTPNFDETEHVLDLPLYDNEARNYILLEEKIELYKKTRYVYQGRVPLGSRAQPRCENVRPCRVGY
ncbi:hypothetical protein DM02DRAFT_618793 [Periconia macrospinosa]|uniref:Uncharacterized protein n=1 Tax=Periconia macrospinosa TaxID=97972 RepID=A0A2V1D7X0_9PLEO|nr:hypothetical protein DM02DRAFT_618793 [Periconia macrospinosa]